jgi:hypothetical protein
MTIDNMPKPDKVEVLGLNPVRWVPTNNTAEVCNFNLIYEVGETKPSAQDAVREIADKTRSLKGKVYSLKKFSGEIKGYKGIVMASDFFDAITRISGYVGVCLDAKGMPTTNIKKAEQRYLIGTIKRAD